MKPAAALPADHAARRHFATETRANLAVCAGAGTGKTTAISARIARIVLEDARDGTDAAARLVVVTYTKAAAAELRARALAAALAAVRDPAGSGHDDLARPAQDRAQRALAGLQRAFFGTIHAFCLALLQQHGVAAGLPPDPDLLGEEQMATLAERFRQSEALEALEVPEELLRYVRFETILSRLPDLAADPPPPPPAGPPPVPDFSRLLLAKAKGRGGPKAEQTKESVRRWLRAREDGRHFLGLPENSSSAAEVEAEFDAALAPLQAWIDATRADVDHRLAQAYADFRLREGALTYDDLIRLTRDLLLDPIVLDAIRAERRLVLLDEAQDTSRPMFEILTEIVRPPGAAWGAWPREAGAVGPCAGAFSLVGDDQQSVYRDRARPEDFADYSNALVAAGGAPLDLSVTMRCDRAVVDFVNAVFADRGVSIAGGDGPARFRPLTARAAAGPGAVWRLSLPPPVGTKVAETRAAEARGVAAWLARVGPAGLGVESWGEIALIAPRKGWLEPMETALRDHGIPVCSRAAVRAGRTLPAWSWPVALLHVIAEPWDRFELIGVLRDIFGIRDPDLLRAHRRGALGFTRPPTDAQLSPALAAALQTLAGLHRLSLQPATTGVGMLDAIIERTALTARLSAVDASADALAILREAAAKTCHTGEPWRAWVRAQVAALERQPPELPPRSDGVELIGAQKAKGLQWKVVIPVGLGQGISDRGGCAPEERPRREAELRRFLYVTLTRARERLILPDTTTGFHPAPKASSPAYTSLLGHLTEGVRALPEAPAGESAPWPEPPPTPQPVIDWTAAARASRPPARKLRAAEPKGARPTPDLPEPLLEAAGGIGYGTWWHESIARFPWRADAAARLAWRNAELEIASGLGLRTRGEADVDRFLGCEELHALVGAAARAVAEAPLTYAQPGAVPRWLEGSVDLLVFAPDGSGTVLDWKTDRLAEREQPAAFAARLRQTHERQLTLYAKALRDGAGLPITRILLYATATGALIECAPLPAPTTPTPTPTPTPPTPDARWEQLDLFDGRA